MRDHLREYFTLISAFNRASAVSRALLRIPTQRALEELAGVVPAASRLFREVNAYLAANFFQPRISTQ